MNQVFYHQTTPFTVPTTDGKRIDEHFGRVATKTDALSIARMVAPPGWTEPPQQPDFGEYTLMVSGRKRVEIDGSVVELSAGESLFVPSGALVRYSNPYDEPAVYWSVCTPAFAPELAHRRDESA